MYRTRIERLEERKLFSVTDLIIDPFGVEAAPTSLVGDFNGDGRDDVAEYAGRDGFLLPYLEQVNLYKSITDGTSNTLMLGEDGPAMGPKLISALVDTSPIDVQVSRLDVWEHAYSLQKGAATNGIIAILIGLAADPTDPTGNTAAGANGGQSQVTHDLEFEKWANASRFDRGYLPPALEDVLVSSILHEDNEFSFPRMFAGGVRVG